MSTLQDRGVVCDSFVADISLSQNCFAAVDAAIAKFGRLDVLVNCAGITHIAPAADLSEDVWNRMLAVNLSAPFWFYQAALPHLLASQGCIINVASNSAVKANAYIAAYAATKAGLTQLTKALALEHVDAPIRINAVAPGGMATEMASESIHMAGADVAKLAPMMNTRGINETADVAAVVAFLASPPAKVFHGAILIADQGVAAG